MEFSRGVRGWNGEDNRTKGIPGGVERQRAISQWKKKIKVDAGQVRTGGKLTRYNRIES